MSHSGYFSVSVTQLFLLKYYTIIFLCMKTTLSSELMPVL